MPVTAFPERSRFRMDTPVWPVPATAGLALDPRILCPWPSRPVPKAVVTPDVPSAPPTESFAFPSLDQRWINP